MMRADNQFSVSDDEFPMTVFLVVSHIKIPPSRKNALT